jgi:hypothetical protein
MLRPTPVEGGGLEVAEEGQQSTEARQWLQLQNKVKLGLTEALKVCLNTSTLPRYSTQRYTAHGSIPEVHTRGGNATKTRSSG